MSRNSHGSAPRRYVPTDTSASSAGKEKTAPQTHNSCPILLKAFPDPNHANSCLGALACPVLGCSFVFEGEMRDGYLWRHLGRPRIARLTSDEKAAWLDLHKIERDKLLATRITPAQRRSEANKVKAQKMLRTGEFELRARNMGITEKELVTQKVAIWEGMFAAKQSGDSIGYHAWLLLDFSTSP